MFLNSIDYKKGQIHWLKGSFDLRGPLSTWAPFAIALLTHVVATALLKSITIHLEVTHYQLSNEVFKNDLHKQIAA